MGVDVAGPHRLRASPVKSSPFVNGACHFVEDHAGPPSRAFLKLWEALVRLGRWPAGERCPDLGASPGGRTWGLATLGANVTAVDKAPLAATVAAMPGVTQRRENAFGIAPAPVDRLFSDLVA
jgi:23S rRNA (cytidine2498-2'-O)-methyltransferase